MIKTRLVPLPARGFFESQEKYIRRIDRELDTISDDFAEQQIEVKDIKVRLSSSNNVKGYAQFIVEV